MIHIASYVAIMCGILLYSWCWECSVLLYLYYFLMFCVLCVLLCFSLLLYFILYYIDIAQKNNKSKNGRNSSPSFHPLPNLSSQPSLPSSPSWPYQPRYLIFVCLRAWRWVICVYERRPPGEQPSSTRLNRHAPYS